MSRTRKDRPYWVKVNDPTSPRYASHNHIVTLSEVVGEEPVYRDGYDKHGNLVHDVLYYIRKLYKHWPAQVDCTLDRPTAPPCMTNLSKVWRSPDNDARLSAKHCEYRLIHDGDYVSGRTWKCLTNGAVRSKVRQQLHEALLNKNWDHVDIFTDSKYDSRGWWD
jgi:hypothetical protein